MLIGHIPLGYLIARGLKNVWQKSVQTPRQRYWLYGAAIAGSVFPDFDLFYYYLVNAFTSHRLLPTHSFIPYSILLIIGTLLNKRQPHRVVGFGILLFALGGIGHIIADMYTGMAAGFAPLSLKVFGLYSLASISNSWFGRYPFLTNYITEYFIYAVALLYAVRKKALVGIILGIATGIVLPGLLYINNFIYRPNGVYYYSDADHDGIIAILDRDSDGDGTLNRFDADIDDDGIGNRTELAAEVSAARGALYDTTNGGLVEIPMRIGFVTGPVLIERLFGNIGNFISTEMAFDYGQQPEGYQLDPKNDQFADLPENWQTWLAHTGSLFPPSQKPKEFDLLFFSSGHVGIFVQNDGKESVLEAHSSHPHVKILPLADVIAREGELTGIGRILAVTPHKTE